MMESLYLETRVNAPVDFLGGYLRQTPPQQLGFRILIPLSLEKNTGFHLVWDLDRHVLWDASFDGGAASNAMFSVPNRGMLWLEALTPQDSLLRLKITLDPHRPLEERNLFNRLFSPPEALIRAEFAELRETLETHYIDSLLQAGPMVNDDALAPEPSNVSAA